MGGRGAAGSDFVTLYHVTDRAAAESILKNGFAPRYTTNGRESAADWYKNHESQFGFFTKSLKGAGGYGDTTVAVRVRKAHVQKDRWSGHFKVPVSKLPKRGWRISTQPYHDS